MTTLPGRDNSFIMLRSSWCSALLSAFCLFQYVTASAHAGGFQALWLYYVYSANVAAFGPGEANFLPTETKDATSQLTLYAFIQKSLVQKFASKRNKNTPPAVVFEKGYETDITTAKAILDTTMPDPIVASNYLNEIDWFNGVFDTNLLFGAPGPISLPEITEAATTRMQKARQKAGSAIYKERQIVMSLMNEIYEWRRVETAKGVLKLLEKQTIPGLTLVTQASPVDSSIQVLDMEETIRQSSKLDPEAVGKIQKLFEDIANQKATTQEDRNDKLTAQHQVGLAAVQTQMGRVVSDDPNC